MTDGWFLNMCSDIRDRIADDADIIAGAATILAAFFIVARMVRFHYSLSSDESGGGLGDVKAWDFIKPVFLLLLIGMSPQIGSAINAVVGETSKVITADTKHLAVKSLMLVRKQDELEKKEERLRELKSESGSRITEYDYLLISYADQCYYQTHDNNLAYIEWHVMAFTGKQYEFVPAYYPTIPKEKIGKSGTLTIEDYENHVIAHRMDYLDIALSMHQVDLGLANTYINAYTTVITDEENGIKALKKEIEDISMAESDQELKDKYGIDEGDLLIDFFPMEYPDFPELFQHDFSWSSPFRSIANALGDAATYLPRIFMWLFKCILCKIGEMIFHALVWLFMNIPLIRGLMATAGMCVMLYFFPLVFLAMLFDRYKGAFGDWLVIFVELSLWFPLATIMMNISLYTVKELFVAGMATREMLLMVVVAGTLTIFSVSELAKSAMIAFGRHGEPPSSGGLMMPVAGGALAIGKKTAPLGGKMVVGKKIAKIQAKRADKKVAKERLKNAKTIEKYKAKETALTEKAMESGHDYVNLKNSLREKIDGKSSLSTVLPAMRETSKAKREVKRTEKDLKKIDKRLAKQQTKVKAAQKRAQDLHEKVKNYRWKQTGAYTKDVLVKIPLTKGREFASAAIPASSGIYGHDVINFTKRNAKAIYKAAKFGTKASGKVAKGFVKAGAAVPGAVKDTAKVAVGTAREIRTKVSDFAKKTWKKVSHEGLLPGGKKYQKVAGNEKSKFKKVGRKAVNRHK